MDREAILTSGLEKRPWRDSLRTGSKREWKPLGISPIVGSGLGKPSATSRKRSGNTTTLDDEITKVRVV